MDKKKGFIDPGLPDEKKDELTPYQREQLRKKFIFKAPGAKESTETEIERDTSRVNVFIRIPRYCVEDVELIHRITGQNKTSIYIDLLRTAIRQKLKELKEVN